MGRKTAFVIRRRVNGDFHFFSGFFVKNIIFSLKSFNRIVRIPQHFRNLRSIHSCAVKHPPDGNILCRCMNNIAFIPALNFQDPVIKKKFRTVHAGIFRQGNGILHRIKNSGGRHIHGKLAACVGIDLIKALFVDHFHASDTVFLADGLVFQNIFSILFIKANYQLACSFKWNIQLLCHLVKLPVSLHSTLRFQRARPVGKTRMKHSCISA